MRDKLNRLHRRTKGYSKNLRLLEGSIALVCRRLDLFNTNAYWEYPPRRTYWRAGHYRNIMSRVRY